MSGDAQSKPHINLLSAPLYAAQIANEVARGSAASAVLVLESLIAIAFMSRASDIHINPTSDKLAVRLRIDGVLELTELLPLSMHHPLIARLKILCGLRTDEHAAAQDGRWRFCLGADLIDIRVSIMPLYYGENAVLRLLSAGDEVFSLASLGFTARNEAKIVAAMQKPYGMILATGPTGSGKTTTLYTVLSLEDATKTAIVTIEDPIEYAMQGVNQIQVNPRTGLTFAHGLRSILRQDPNTIMVGEIRDSETAGLAVNIALTGHIVVSTLHTNDAATTLPRLLDMKIEPYLIASTVTIAIGQRLVRRLCMACRHKRILDSAETEIVNKFLEETLRERETPIWTAVGCAVCHGSGYYGRIGIHEVLEVTPAVRSLILARAPAEELRLQAVADGMLPLIADGISKALAGITTLEEVLKIHYE